LLVALLAASAAAPALAQHHGGHAPAAVQPQPPADPHAGHARPAGTGAAAPGHPDPHAGHGVPANPPPDPHAGHAMPPTAPPDPHAGHAMPPPAPPAPQPGPHQGHDAGAAPAAADPHAGHRMDPAATEALAPPAGPPPPEATGGPVHAADVVFGNERMAAAREALRASHGDHRTARFMIDQLEYVAREGADGFVWEDVQFWYGGDIDKLWLKSEGEAVSGDGLERGEVQALWSHAIAPFFDLQAGLRYDFGPGPDRGHLVLGVQGLAPYWFEIDGALFLSDEGDLTARFEAEHDVRITQRLILQPRVELDLSLQDVPELNLGAGVSSAEAGLRLRYEIVPELAPYVGVQYERAFGDTADFLRGDGGDVGGWGLVAGLRAWF
jgi:copper resistance protein B